MGKASSYQIKTYYAEISRYSQPEEFFGDLGNTAPQQFYGLELVFKSLIKLYHPDQYVGQKDDQIYATEITKLLNRAKQHALIKIKSAAYGKMDTDGGQIQIKTPSHEYYVTQLLVEGAQADIFKAYYVDPDNHAQPVREVVIKRIADPANNHWIKQEVSFYQEMVHFCFPEYIEDFCTSDGKRAVVLSYVAGAYDLMELKRIYCQNNNRPGIPQEHFVWILERFLSALGLMHENGILHGNIQPDNLMIQPQNHNGVLIDFLHCRIHPAGDEVFDIINPAYCAPEVLTRHFRPHPVSDIYALGRCMIELLGGQGDCLDDDIALHPDLRQLLGKMIEPNPLTRSADAWALAAELKALRQQIYGKAHHYIPLVIGG